MLKTTEVPADVEQLTMLKTTEVTTMLKTTEVPADTDLRQEESTRMTVQSSTTEPRSCMQH